MQLKELNLYNCMKLTGRSSYRGQNLAFDVASKPRLKNLPGNLLHFSSRLPSTPTSPGDIGAFAGMPLEQLNMKGCGYKDYESNITGELVANMYGARSVMPQGLA